MSITQRLRPIFMLLPGAMNEEYKAITEAGLVLQIDDPRVVVQYDMLDPVPSVEACRQFARLRLEALNHALRGIPSKRVWYHLC